MNRPRLPGNVKPESASSPAPGLLRSRVVADLDAAGLSPNHRLGQNFMVDGGMLDRLVGSAELQTGERVIEIGPGTGLLTERLLAKGAQVIAVELDRGLHGFLSQRFAPAIAAGQLQLVHGDCLETKSRLHPQIVATAQRSDDDGRWSLVANLPYDVAIPVLLNALTLTNPPQVCVVTIQWEAAQRLIAAPGSAAWGASAAVAQAAGSGEIIARLPPRCFYPQPRVDSAMIRWRPRAGAGETFATWCRQLFAYRRKVLPGALRDAGCPRETVPALLATAGLDPGLRLENLGVDPLLALHRAWMHHKINQSKGTE